MSSVRHCITGLPRPVGSTFRQRQVWADESYGSDHKVTWVVSVVDTAQGPMVEARKAVTTVSIVALDLPKHGTQGNDLLTQVKALLDVEDGWKVETVRECSVAGCTNPQPMWHNGWRNQSGECLTCEMRTVQACVLCGAPDSGYWNMLTRERMLAEQLCFLCDGWLRIAEKHNGTPQQVVTPEYQHYVIGKGGGPASCRGFGGTKWAVSFTDGRIVQTDDLWQQGQVPEWLRDRFTPNGTIVSEWTAKAVVSSLSRFGSPRRPKSVHLGPFGTAETETSEEKS